MYGDGLIARRQRYTSKGLAPSGLLNRCEGTIWNASPPMMYSRAASTMAWNCPLVTFGSQRAPSLPCVETATPSPASRFSMASIRATASSYSSRSGRWIVSNCRRRVTWSNTARSSARKNALSGIGGGAPLASGRRSKCRAVS